MSDMHRFPMLRFELEASKLSLLRALDDRNDEVQEMIKRSFENAITQMQGQIDLQVRVALSRVFQEAIALSAETVKEDLADEIAKRMAEHIKAAVVKGMK